MRHHLKLRRWMQLGVRFLVVREGFGSLPDQVVLRRLVVNHSEAQLLQGHVHRIEATGHHVKYGSMN